MLNNDLQARAEKLSKHLTKEVDKAFSVEKEKWGSEVAEALEMHFVSYYLAESIMRSLTSYPEDGTPTSQYKTTSENFLYKKILVQEAVACAFTAAMARFSGQYVDYHCQIKVIADTSKETC